MLFPLVMPDPARREPELDPYAEWQAALQGLRDDFEMGARPAVRHLRAYLESIPGQQRSEALQDLVAEHMRLTWQAGAGTHLDAYLDELSDQSEALASAALVPADLVEDEFLARYQLPHGDTPSVDEYRRRFPGRADVVEQLERRLLDRGRYVKLRLLGLGAMGEIWAAYDRHLRRRVAIKHARPRHADEEAGEDAVSRLAAEATVTARLEHPGIVSVHEYCAGDRTAPYCVMQLVEGQTLGELIWDYHQPPLDRTARQQRLVLNNLLRSLVAVSDAIGYAHARGILHRDLKPGNVVVGEFGEAVILDWGLAISVGSVPGDTSPVAGAADPALGRSEADAARAVGTPDYMPPEQVDGVADTRSDLFGLGAILYEILTARPPHAWPDGSRPPDWQQVVRAATILSPRRLASGTPRALDAICMKALAREPDERYQSARDFAADLLRYVAGEPVSAWTEPAPVRARRWLLQRLM